MLMPYINVDIWTATSIAQRSAVVVPYIKIGLLTRKPNHSTVCGLRHHCDSRATRTECRERSGFDFLYFFQMVGSVQSAGSVASRKDLGHRALRLRDSIEHFFVTKLLRLDQDHQSSFGEEP